MEQFSWARFYKQRKAVRKVYPSNYGLALKKKLTDIVEAELNGKEKLLDVGASDKEMGERIKRKFPSIVCKTMDVDRANQHDYYSLGEIKEKFDMVVLAEVIEHLPFNEGMKLLKELNGILGDGGKIIVSTPNMHHPNRFFWDSDHKTHFRYDEVGAALIEAGFEIKGLFRVYNDQFLRRFVRISLMGWLHRYLDVDFARSIVAVAVKK